MIRHKMFKLVLIASGVISCATYIFGVTIDNRLVTARHDCFERIALGAMLPFEKTFRTVDTNSLRECEEMCSREGDMCQTYSLGIHIHGGNGTCQLSAEVIDATRARPVGTIFDPDFDLYARRNNCVTEPPQFPPGFGSPPNDRDINRPSSPFPISTTVVNGPPTIVFTQEPSTTNGNTLFSTTPLAIDVSQSTFSNTRPTPDTSGQTGSTTIDSTIPIDMENMNRFPTTSRYPAPTDRTPEVNTPSRDRPTTEGYPPRDNYPNRFGESDRYPVKDRYPEKYPERQPPFDSKNYGNRYTPTNGDRDPLNDRYPEYPSYDYPNYYNDKPYPSSSNKDRYPSSNGYDQNQSPPSKDRYPNYDYGPNPPQNTYNTPAAANPSNNDQNYYFHYGNGDRYGQGNGYDNLGNGYANRPPYAPASSANRPSHFQGSVSDTRPSSDANGYGQRPPMTIPVNNNGYGTQSADRPETTSQRPSSGGGGVGGYDTTSSLNYNKTQTHTVEGGGNGYDNMRPDPPTGGYSPRPDDTTTKRPSVAHSNGNAYHVTEEPIEIYFNPDSYYQTKPKPGSSTSTGYGSDTYNDACFRRVLAGKRVAPHWVRRTLSCERVEDCQRECGEEKRFTCEGFNYKLDPSGHGQGICELIEVPLHEMDVYSSARNRDTNLLRHPDYDYYERDRNAAPGCHQPVGCTDCSYLKPYTPFRPPSSDRYKPYPDQRPYPDYDRDHYRPQTTAVDKYRPPINNRPPAGYNGYDNQFLNYYESGNKHKPFPSDLDRYDPHRPDYRPGVAFGEIPVPSSYHDRPGDIRPDDYRPSYQPYSDHGSQGYRPPNRPHHNYLDRDPPNSNKPISFVPYTIGQGSYGSYGGNYGSNYQQKGSHDYWGVRDNDLKRVDGPAHFNYFNLGKNPGSGYSDNSLSKYPNNRYSPLDDRRKINYGTIWTRRPGADDCSVKTSEGFRLHKGIIRFTHNAPNVRECEQMCFSENKFKCFTYSYRYSSARENCLLCDRPYNLLDNYADVEPDRDYDIYSMSDDPKICQQPVKIDRNNNAQCFFRAIDSNRFFKSIIRDSLSVQSVGECEMECIKSTKFTCRAFTFRYGSLIPGSIIDNCQLSDWPVKDMDKERHLVRDPGFDVFERASYGHGCEIRPIIDSKNQKLCYLGYGSPAKLLSSAIKKVISVPTELECKNECSRFRESSQFKCLSFSFGSRISTFNCEMSDLDQSELKLNIHYAHTNDRDYWLFAWNPFDWTCRDKVATIGGGGNRVNNDRRMDIFRDPGESTWRRYTVSGKQCRVGSQCERNQVSGFYSCEIDGGEIGSWDYCCRDDHPCGYSQGFQYPWCFVGDGADQWRKCSDRYFPVKKDYLLASGTTKVPDRKKGDYHQSPPKPGGLQHFDEAAAKLWPVTYFYDNGPPNSTELSNAIDCKKEAC